jgi:hypothetical protein
MGTVGLDRKSLASMKCGSVPVQANLNMSQSQHHVAYMANERCFIPQPVDEYSNHVGDTEDGLQESKMAIHTTRLNWCYLVSTHYLLPWWYFANTTAKQAFHKPDEKASPPSRIDSRIDVGIADNSSETWPRRHEPTRPAPITLLFHFSDSASPSIKLLPYRTFSKWTSLYALLDEWKQDGVVVSDLWDVEENMPVFGGDWDARVRPGWVVELRCCNDESGYFGRGYDGYSDGYGDGYSSSEDGDDTSEDACGYETESDNGMSGKSRSKSVTSQHPWTFKRWKERVEKERVKREDVLGEPSWFVMLMWRTLLLLL